MQDIITIVKYGIAFWKKESCVQVSQDKIEKCGQRSQLEATAQNCQ